MTFEPQKTKTNKLHKLNQTWHLPSEYYQTTNSEGLSNPPIIIRTSNFCCRPGKHGGD